MNFIKQNKYWLLLILLLVIVIIFLNRSKENYKYESYNRDLVLNDTIQYYKLQDGQRVASIKSLKVQNSDIKNQKYILDDSLAKLSKKFSKIVSATIIKTEIKIDTIQIPYEIPVPIKFEKIFEKETEDYYLSGLSTQEGITIDGLHIPTTVRLITGYKKKNFFKSELTTDVTTSNPYLDIQDIENQTVIVKHKRFMVGPFVGYDITGNVTVGIGIGYGIFKF